MMPIHPAIDTVNKRIESDVIGGAADTAKEVARAVQQVVSDSAAADAPGLFEELRTAVLAILKILPSFAPPMNALHRIMKAAEDSLENDHDRETMRHHVLAVMDEFMTFAEKALVDVASYGAELIHDGDTLFMYSMSSTVWRVIKAAHDQGKQIRVLVTESRPANEGMWTVEKMVAFGIPVEVNIDAMMGLMIPLSDLVMVGADSVAATGRTLCKVGTYPCALVAREHGVPFYVAADTLKFDTSTLLGLPFRVDPVPRHEVLPRDTYPEAIVGGALFDVTPPALISGIITERGIINPAAAYSVLQDIPLSKIILEKLPDWAHNRL